MVAESNSAAPALVVFVGCGLVVKCALENSVCRPDRDVQVLYLPQSRSDIFGRCPKPSRDGCRLARFEGRWLWDGLAGTATLMSRGIDASAADAAWMKRALGLAKQAAAAGEVPVGAVVVLDGNVIGEGLNRPISSCDPTAHAEIEALRDAAKRLDNYRLLGATLYVTIEPCTMCAGALVHSRIKRLCYGTPEPRAGAVHSTMNVLDNPGLNHRVQVDSGVLAPEAAALMTEFFRSRRR